MNFNKIKQYWDNSSTNMAHISYDYVRRAFPVWEKYFLSTTDFYNKIVIDYGIGGGFLGKILFEKHNIKKYIGIDISERQIDVASKNLIQYNTEFLKTPVNLENINADIFVCQSVIQHFPTEIILQDFLQNVNNSTCVKLIIQIRYDSENIFSNKYDSHKDICYACYTNSEYIGRYLTNYEIVSKSDVDAKTKYQNLIFQRKHA